MKVATSLVLGSRATPKLATQAVTQAMEKAGLPRDGLAPHGLSGFVRLEGALRRGHVRNKSAWGSLCQGVQEATGAAET